MVLTIHRVKPWSALTESSEIWNAGVLFGVYRSKMLNLMEWMSAGEGDTPDKPAWASNYSTTNVIESWKSDYTKNKTLDYSCLIPVRLDLQQKLKIHIQTFVSSIHGTDVRNEKKVKSYPAVAQRANEAEAAPEDVKVEL